MDIEIIPADEPKKLKLDWVIVEEQAQVWMVVNGTWVTLDKYDRYIDSNGFLLDNKGKQMKDADDNFMLAKDFPLEKK